MSPHRGLVISDGLERSPEFLSADWVGIGVSRTADKNRRLDAAFRQKCGNRGRIASSGDKTLARLVAVNQPFILKARISIVTSERFAFHRNRPSANGLQNQRSVGNPLDAFGSPTFMVFEPSFSRSEPLSRLPRAVRANQPRTSALVEAPLGSRVIERCAALPWCDRSSFFTPIWVLTPSGHDATGA